MDFLISVATGRDIQSCPLQSGYCVAVEPAPNRDTFAGVVVLNTFYPTAAAISISRRLVKFDGTDSALSTVRSNDAAGDAAAWLARPLDLNETGGPNDCA